MHEYEEQIPPRRNKINIKKTHFFLFFLLRFLFNGLVDVFPDFLELVLSFRTKMNLV